MTLMSFCPCLLGVFVSTWFVVTNLTTSLIGVLTGHSFVNNIWCLRFAWKFRELIGVLGDVTKAILYYWNF